MLVLLTVMCACTPGGGETPRPTGGTGVPRGGVLELGLLTDLPYRLDPARGWSPASFELFRCCLLRTLLSPDVGAVAEGGIDLRADLATDLPRVSADGLTYVFELKQGVTYSPPLDDVEVTAQDFVRALQRLSDPRVAAPYAFYFSETGGLGGIVGFDAADGGPIEGVSTLDDHTLVITLEEPAGDLPWRMSLPATAPIPPKPGDPEAPYGIADGHDDDFSGFAIGAGPYMVQGMGAVDLGEPADRQVPGAGYVPGRSLVLVRNPAWGDDDLRPAYVEAIHIEIGGTPRILADGVDAGTLDLVLDAPPPTDQVRAYLEDEARADRVHVNPTDTLHFIALNIAQPPFDDIYVRRAAAYALDKASLRRTVGGELAGSIAGHIIPPALLGGSLDAWDPYPTPNSAGDVTAAQTEMARSAYDRDRDGTCDVAECEGVLTIVDRAPPYPEQAEIIARSWRQIGIELDVRTGDRNVFVSTQCVDPSRHPGVCPSLSWETDYPDAATFGLPLLEGSAIGPAACCNFSLLGAPAALLQDHGYATTDVPSVDRELSACSSAPVGDERVTCWSALDRTVMEDILPLIPWMFAADVDVVSQRVLNHTFDGATGMVAIDHLAVDPATA